MSVRGGNHHLFDWDANARASLRLRFVYQCLRHHASVNDCEGDLGSSVVENDRADEETIIDLR